MRTLESTGCAEVPLSREDAIISRRKGRTITGRKRRSSLLRIPGAAVFGFAVPAVFAGLLRLPRGVYLIPCWSGGDIGKSVRFRWLWGVGGALVAGVGIQSLITPLTGSPLPVVPGHATMHVTAVPCGSDSVIQLPPPLQNDRNRGTCRKMARSPEPDTVPCCFQKTSAA